MSETTTCKLQHILLGAGLGVAAAALLALLREQRARQDAEAKALAKQERAEAHEKVRTDIKAGSIKGPAWPFTSIGLILTRLWIDGLSELLLHWLRAGSVPPRELRV